MRRLVVLLLALTTVVQGYDIMADRCWEVGGEALFWRSCGSPYDYGLRAPDVFNQETLSLKSDYDVGFRIWGATYTHDCCHLFDVDWIHLRTFDKQRETGSIQLFPNNQGLADAVANSHLKYGYDKVTIRAGRYVAQHCKSKMWAYGGTGYLNIKRDQQVIAVSAAGTSEKSVERASYEGGLLEVGVGVDVEEPYCIHLVGKLGGLIGIGERKLRHTFTTGNTATYTHPGETSCITGLHLRLGVQWRYEVCCKWVMLQVSYELDQYFDALRLAQSQSTFNFNSPTALNNVGFSGPSVSLAVRF